MRDEHGHRVLGTIGTPQGAVVSPLMANVYLHYVFDLWVQQWRKRHARGIIVVVRYADDVVVGFQNPDDAARFRREIAERLQAFGLALHPDKTRLIRFGRFAQEQKRKGPRQTRDLQLPGLYAHYLRGKPSRTFPDSPQNAQRSPTGKTQGDKPRVEKAPPPPGSCHGPLASERRPRPPE